MGIELLTERHADQIAGVLSCYDRILIFGTLPGVCFAGGMTSYLYQHEIRIFDYPRFAEPFRNLLRENAARIAADNGLEIEHIGKKNFRKDDKIKKVLQKRGDHPGLVWIFSAMDAWPAERQALAAHTTIAMCLLLCAGQAEERCSVCHPKEVKNYLKAEASDIVFRRHGRHLWNLPAPPSTR